jgi:hypothetical protein
MTSVARTLVLRNTGDPTLRLGTVAVTGAAAAAFEVDFDACTTAWLRPGWPCSVTVRAHPDRAGDLRAEAVIDDDSGHGPTRLPLTATGAIGGPGLRRLDGGLQATTRD